MTRNDRAKSTLILAILCAAILLVILTGCGSHVQVHDHRDPPTDYQASQKQYVRTHDCKIESTVDTPPMLYADGEITNGGWTGFDCQGVTVIITHHAERPWRP
jgi:hypothetical protein